MVFEAQNERDVRIPIMDPTEKGVWWKDDNQWVIYPPEIATQILRANKKGDAKITVGPFKSSLYPSGTSYAIDLLATKQKNLSTGLSRDIKIVSTSSDEEGDEWEEEADDDPFVTPGGVPQPHVNISNREAKGAAGKDIVRMVPSIIVDLQKLSSRCTIEDQCNLILKLPKIVVQSERLKSLTRKTLVLLLEKLTTKDFIKSVVASKLQSCQGSNQAWTISECNSYILGRAQNPDMYSSFVDHVVSLAEEDEGLVDALFSVAEKGSTEEGDRVEYLFRIYSSSERGSGGELGGNSVIYTRLLPLPSEEGRMRVCVHLTMSHFVQGKTVVKGATLPIAQLTPTLPLT